MAERNNDFKKGTANFRLVGKLRVTPNSFAMDKKSENNFISNKMYIGVECGNGNVVFSQMFGGYKVDDDDNAVSKIYAHGSKADPNNPKRSLDDYESKMEIPWDERNDEIVLQEVGPSCFTQVGLERNTKGELLLYKFLSSYDAIDYIKKTYDNMDTNAKDSIVVEVRGNIEYRYYQGKVSYQKNITSVKLKDNITEDEYVSEFTQTIYADKNSIGKADMEKLILPLTVKVPEYVNKYSGIEVKETVPLDIELQIDAQSKIAKSLATKIKGSKNYSCIIVIGSFVESGATEEFNIDSLNDEMKQALEDGLITEEDIKFTVASGNQRSQIMSINRLKVIKDENNELGFAFEENVYTEKEMDLFADKFFTIVNEVDSASEDSEEVDPTDDGADEPPFDTDDSKPVDDMDWMKNFQ